MKKLLLAATVLFTGCCSMAKLDLATQVPVDNDGNVCFIQTVPVDSTTQDELYSRSREWFTNSFPSASNVLDMDDRADGKLIGKGNADISTEMGGAHWRMFFSLYVYVKKGKYQYKLTNITYKFDPYYNATEQTTKTAEELITPSALKCACFIARARIKLRNATMNVNNGIAVSLKKALATKSDF